MSLRKLYDQAVQNQTRTVDSLDDAALKVVRQAVETIRLDGDFHARLEKITPDLKFLLHITPQNGRAYTEVALPLGEVRSAYAQNGGDVTGAANDVVENVIGKMARAQADLRYSIALSERAYK